MTSKVLNPSTGSWAEGKAAPRLLPEQLRSLPSEYVTNEVEDKTRVHELDPDHIREALVDERKSAEQNKKPDLQEQRLPKLPDARHTKCTQENIDLIRLRVLAVITSENARRLNAGEKLDTSVKHVWFEHDDVLGKCELRHGNPPPQRDRPRHLQFRHLEIDPMRMPDTITQRIGRDRELAEAYKKHIGSVRQSSILDANGNPIEVEVEE